MSFELKFWSNVFDDVRFMVWMGLSWISILLGANLSSDKKRHSLLRVIMHYFRQNSTSCDIDHDRDVTLCKSPIFYWRSIDRTNIHVSYCQASYLIKQQKLTYMYYVIYWHNIRYLSIIARQTGSTLNVCNVHLHVGLVALYLNVFLSWTAGNFLMCVTQ